MQHVDVKVHGSIATVVLDRAGSRNALSESLLEDLQEAFGDLHQEKRVRAVILTAAGDHFCAGVDLRLLAAINQLPELDSLAKLHDYWRQLTELFEQMLRFPKPIIAAVDGSAIGAGFGLALSADIILPSERATFSATAPRRGLVGGATAALLAWRAGGAIASRLLLTGEAVSSAESHRLGLSTAPIAADQIWVAATELGRRCAEAPAEAIQATKRILNEHIGECLLSQLSGGAADSASACTTEAAVEGVRAFLERRDPNWP